MSMLKFKSQYFVPITLLSLFLSITPALSQVLYKATVNSQNGGQTAQVAHSSDVNKLANSIYKLIKPQANRRPNITVSLGTVNLNTFQNSLRSKGISAEYYEFLGSPSFSKSGWQSTEPINMSSVRSRSTFYGVVLTKSGYGGTEKIPFKVTEIRNNTPIVKFDRSQINLKDGTTITFTIDAGNSGLNPTLVGKLVTEKDSRLLMSQRSVTIANAPAPGCASSNVQRSCGGENSSAGSVDYSIKLSRN
jgi:hypothetical protein